jgi:multiple sugar transport system ATP-binding protein
MASIAFEGVTKVYEDGTLAVSDLDLVIDDGEFMVLVGPSGCGKSTALRMIAGLEAITEGKIAVGDQVVNDLPPKDRDVAMVFQNYALYPHMTVFENMAFALKIRHLDKAEQQRRVREAAQILGLDDLLDRRPKQLSGGQRQRVAMGRAIVREPRAFLMDEPLSNLDAKLRVQMRSEIARIQSRLGTTTVYVTHDQVEAMTMGDRVAVLKHGVLQQVAEPQELYDHPANLFVAGFIGSPAMNMVEALLERDGDRLAATFAGVRLDIDTDLLRRNPAIEGYEGKPVIVGIRPEQIEDATLTPGAPATRRFTPTIELCEGLGYDVLAHFTIDAPPVVTEDTKELQRDTGLEAVSGTAGSPFIARLDPRTSARKGQRLELSVDTSRLHFFDPADGHGIA